MSKMFCRVFPGEKFRVPRKKPILIKLGDQDAKGGKAVVIDNAPRRDWSRQRDELCLGDVFYFGNTEKVMESA